MVLAGGGGGGGVVVGGGGTSVAGGRWDLGGRWWWDLGGRWWWDLGGRWWDFVTGGLVGIRHTYFVLGVTDTILVIAVAVFHARAVVYRGKDRHEFCEMLAMPKLYEI